MLPDNLTVLHIFDIRFSYMTPLFQTRNILCTCALICLFSPTYGQNKKEQILILNTRIDSLKDVLIKERTSAENESNRLNATIFRSRRKTDSLLSALTRTSSDLQQRESRMNELNRIVNDMKSAQAKQLQSIRQKNDSLIQYSVLYRNIKLRSDSLSKSLRQLKESVDNPQSPVSTDELRKLTKANLDTYDTDDLITSMDALTENRFYEDTRSREEGIYEEMIGNTVFVRGFVSSGCGDCYNIVLNYYTSDGFLFHQEQQSVCMIEPAPYYTSVKMTIDPQSGMKSFEIHNGRGEQLNLESIKNSAAALKNFRNVPAGYRSTGTTKPQVFQCVTPRGLE